MLKKKRIIFQFIGAIVILGVLLFGKRVPNNPVNKLYNYTIAAIMNEVTIEELNSAGSSCFSLIKNTPEKVVNAVVSVNEQSKYAYPIDKKSSTKVKQIHSVAGGMVSEVGNSKELGLFISIKHQDAVSTYGHLSDIFVIPMQRVQRGEIVGCYDEDCNEKFYYQLNEDL